MTHEEDQYKRPKGILKNSPKQKTATDDIPAPAAPAVTVVDQPPNTDTKEVTLQNTLQNAGRRHSSQGPSSRRQSVVSAHSQHSNNNNNNNNNDNDSPHHLRWDEANLYLAEQEKTAKMKIDEPKTPFAPQYDPAHDEEEMKMAEAQESLLNAQQLVVDELDDKDKPKKTKKARTGPGGFTEEDIPEFELGEPEEEVPSVGDAGDGSERIVRGRSLSNDSQKGQKHVVVGVDVGDGAGGGGSSSGDPRLTPEEYEQKHHEFEERRKKHYEMKNIKELLAHPEQLDAMEDEDEDEDEDKDNNKNSAAPAQPPAVPRIPERFLNGKK